MNDTTATVRKEILEDAKAEIDARIENWRLLQKAMGGDDNGSIDALIDEAMIEKDNLPQVLFNDEPSVEEAFADFVGTYPSPIIYGGDIVEIIPQAGDGEIPF